MTQRRSTPLDIQTPQSAREPPRWPPACQAGRLALLAAAREAFTEAVVLTATVSAVLVIVAAIVTVIVLRDAGTHQSSKAEATS